MKTLVAVLALALAAIAVPVQAQDPESPTGITLSATGAGTVAYEGSGTFTVTANIGCAEFITNQPDTTVVISVVDPPAWLNATEGEVDVGPEACIGTTSGRITATGTIPFTVSKDAPAVAGQLVTIQGMMGETPATNTPTASYTVAYKSDYDLTPFVQFPLTVMNKTTTFTVTGVQASNAPSMIMVDDFSACPGALVSGIGPLQYANKAGTPDTKTYTVTFTAPAADWETCDLVLKVYGHYNFDGMAGDPTDQKTFTWQIANGGVPDEKKGDGKDSPAPVGALTALGLLAFAAFARRRRD